MHLLRVLLPGLLLLTACGDDSGTSDLSQATDLSESVDLVSTLDLAQPLDMTLTCPDSELLCMAACIPKDVNHCGACDVACADVAHATKQCASGLCAVAACEADYGNCNTLYSDGCEVSLVTDPLHCGGCVNHACALNNVCAASTCSPVVLAFSGTGTNLAFTSNSRPSATVAGDFNGDTKPDIFAVSSNSGDAKMFLGDGAGGFIGSPLTSAPGQLHGLVAGDFNHDGKLDVAAQGYYGAVILIGKGDGTFETGVPYGTSGDGYMAGDLAVGDLNKDGNDDLVYADYVADGVRVLLGAANGTFGAQTFFSAGAAATAHTSSVVIADWNHDGKLDMAAGNAFVDTVTIYMGVGNGTFTLGTPLVSTGPGHLAAADIDGDGDLDLVVVANGSDHSLFLGNGNGTFGAAIPFAGPGGSGGVTVGDLNRDGRQDIVITNPVDTPDVGGRRSITVFLGSGNSVTPLQYDNVMAPVFNLFAVGETPQRPILVDLDKNGLLDVVTANSNSGDTVNVLFNITM